MFLRIRVILAFLLVILLIAAPVTAAARPLGMVLEAQHAKVGKVAASNGVTVFAGDMLVTDASGTIRIRVGAAQVYLRENSRVKMDEVLGGFSAELQRGIVGFSASGDETINVVAEGVQIRPRSSYPTHGAVQRVNENELIVSSISGELEVLVGNDTHVVATNTSYRVLLEQDPQEVEGVGAEAARRAKLVRLAVGWGLAAGAVAGVVIYNNISPSAP